MNDECSKCHSQKFGREGFYYDLCFACNQSVIKETEAKSLAVYTPTAAEIACDQSWENSH